MAKVFSVPDSDIGFDRVESDWDAVERWLTVLAQTCSISTLDTYRFHLAKLRWYCEHRKVPPLRQWGLGDLQDFENFLRSSPFQAIRPRGAHYGDPDFSPFKVAPSRSSANDIVRFVHALFGVWHTNGYIAVNPAARFQHSKKRHVSRASSQDADLLDQVIAYMQHEVCVKGPQVGVDAWLVRDLFIITALRELGLRASEILAAKMGDVQPDPISLNRKTGLFRAAGNRILPFSAELLSLFKFYRRLFGLPADAETSDTTPLILSVRKQGKGLKNHPQTLDRKGDLKHIYTRMGLYGIVKSRVDKVCEELVLEGKLDAERAHEGINLRWIRHVFERDTILQGESLSSIAHKMAWQHPLAAIRTYLQQSDTQGLRSEGAIAPGSPDLQ